MSFGNIYKDKNVIVTGHTGFKGSWLSAWLTHMGANVIGVSSDIPTEPSNYLVSKVNECVDDNRFNILDTKKICDLVQQVEPDFIFHLAAQALVRLSYDEPLRTMSENAMGSANILEAVRLYEKPLVAVMITSDKAYDNVEWVWGYKETDRLGGKDPYSGSKGMAELAIRSYLESFFSSSKNNKKIGIARAGNVIGGGDWALDRIVPDCVTAWSKNQSVEIRSPNSTRPWQHVLEPLSGYLALGQELHRNIELHGNAYNFGPPANQDHSVAELINLMKDYFNKAKWNDVSLSDEYLHEAGLLKLNCDKALFDLDWTPTMSFVETVKMTSEWYKNYYEDSKSDIKKLTIEQIKEYSKLAEERNLKWTK